MEITLAEKYDIRQLFTDMNSKRKFLELLNFSKRIIYGDKVIPFEKKQLYYYISKDSNKRKINRKTYTTFYVDKKNGDKRIIHAPIKGLKEIQKALNLIIQSIHEPNDSATGFVKNKSVVDNARAHVGKNYVFNIDLKDFFPSIDASRIWGRFLIEPFNLGNSDERKKIANMIKTLCTTEMEVERLVDGDWKKEKRFVLPQGAPTSPTITNAICEKLDRRLSGLSKRFGLKYTRYADDITFSSYRNTYKNERGEKESIYNENSSFRKELLRIINDQNFYIKKSKIRLQKRGYRQEVTGLSVNNKVNISRKYIKDLRLSLYFWEKYGFKKARTLFNNKYGIKKLKNSLKIPNMKMVVEGKLLYLKMVKGPYDSTYLKLKSRFDDLHSSKVDKHKTKKKPLSQLFNELNQIFEKGYQNALKKYIN